MLAKIAIAIKIQNAIVNVQKFVMTIVIVDVKKVKNALVRKNANVNVVANLNLQNFSKKINANVLNNYYPTRNG